jgi:splicing factor 3A subunit 3
VLESARCLESEREANLLMASSILSHGGEPEVDVTNLPGGVQDAWIVMSESSAAPSATSKAATIPDGSKEDVSFPMGQGQLGKAVQMASLSGCLKRVADLQKTLAGRKAMDGATLKKSIRTAKSVVPPTQNGSASIWIKLFDERLREIRAYHARHEDPTNKRPRLGNPAADGYDLASQLSETVQPVAEGTLYPSEEVMGKYLDLQPVYENSVVPIKSVFVGEGEDNKNFGFGDFLVTVSKGLSQVAESKKLSERKKYVRFLLALETYLEGFLKRTQPLLDLNDVSGMAISDFEKEWRKTGGGEGWEAKDNTGESGEAGLNLSPYNTAEDLEKAIDGDTLKIELSRLGLKCGGRVSERAKRLFMTKDTPLDKLPKKLFANNAAPTNGTASTTGSVKSERRVDIARLEVVVMALLNQLKPTLEATSKRTERRETQTVKEREKETDEDLHGSAVEGPKLTDDGDDDDSDDEDAPIYNPKGVPLGWDGKPIPYWLFKLHGLNHFYPCEICGNESYRGRRNFETHFAEAKHSFGMKSLGIPNTKHFHGVTKIEDAQQLWNKLQGHLQREHFDGTKDEEYEDSHGNVLSRSTYEDLARQGLL